ncbi:hypothetical protein [Crenalkalicoccus roseus]|uniref:hypothetical protein n=1 Tax=Crenalkalicoccus roseus TaxID=1485588 RepID=UPI001F023706|nr:hypothetical protein [Crenalkalicoccus roseus]
MSTTTSGPGAYPARIEGAPTLLRRISWGAVFAGVVVALAIGITLNLLGLGVGATTIDATARDTPAASSLGIGAALWILVANLIGLAIGGYVAARLSGTADATDGTLHGLVVWGACALLSVALLGNAVVGLASSAVQGASNALGGLASGVGSIASVATRETASRTDPNTLQSAAQTLAQRAQDALATGGDPARMTPDQRRAEIGRLVGRWTTGNPLSPAERDRLVQLAAIEFELPPQEAEARIQQAERQIQQTLRETEERARQAADASARAASIAAFTGFFVLLLGAGAAVIGARRGTRAVVA